MTASLLETRLRFTKLVPETPGQITETVKQLLAKHSNKVVGRITYNTIRIRIVEKQRHFWSPELSLNLRETGMGTEVKGIYGPKPDIWLGYMFIYFFLGFVTLIVSIVGFSRYNLGLSSYILWLIPFVLGGIIVLLLTSRAGQQLGKDEVNLIHGIIEPEVFMNAEDVELE
ncbi:MAG: hypothetical protein COA58_09415 [Bacteroidetes bacterium]|nr:MAG: hypothetical protein COA58_09415 [Bacteroidota bacterium]